MDKKERNEYLRKIPKVDQLLATEESKSLLRSHPKEMVVEGIRKVLERLRRDIFRTERPEDLKEEAFSTPHLFPFVEEEIAHQVTPHLRRIINATGVVLHTNLGRSPLSEKSLKHLAEISRGYSNLEYDLSEGKRGSRYVHVEDILLRLSGAEAALVVNNNAGAVLLTLNTLAAGKEVIVSRGELVEIGGAFRIPDIMAGSGAILKEVGTTNRTHLRDYETAINENTALLLKVHTSNYRVVGFTAEVSLAELVQLSIRYNIPVMNDLGSGCFVDLSRYGLEKEPTVQDALAGGVDIVTFSGDKLLGGPQAGIILGKKDLIERMKANPLQRALRIDKLTLAAMESTLICYLSEEEAIKEIPALRMMTIPLEKIRRRAQRLARLLKKGTAMAEIEVIQEYSQVGGGALPLQDLPTWAVAVRPQRASVEILETQLRVSNPPIIGRIAYEQLVLDLRTIHDDDVKTIVTSIAQALRNITG